MAFPGEALGYEVSDHQPDDKYRALKGPEGGLRVILQSVDHESRIHLDIETDDKQAEVARLVGLGAKPVAEVKAGPFWHRAVTDFASSVHSDPTSTRTRRSTSTKTSLALSPSLRPELRRRVEPVRAGSAGGQDLPCHHTKVVD